MELKPNGPQNSITVEQVQAMISNTVKSQLGGGGSYNSRRYVKPYTRRIDKLKMPFVYQPPNFQLFDGKGNPKQHVVHFIRTCNNGGTRGELLVKQFVHSLKRTAFNWYTNLEAESIESWDKMELEFLGRFFNTQCVVSMIDLTQTAEWEEEPVIDYINRWRALSLECKDRLTETSAIEMCINGMSWELHYILKGIKPGSFQELATRAHDMELSIAYNKKKKGLSSEAKKEKKEYYKSDKSSESSTKETLSVTTSSAPIKISVKKKEESKGTSSRFVKKDKPTLKEL
ncbi:uncharacterized protein LOC110719148 [Chenopodium quinoa]|uniref:uncharacterized protein LOC110719148 n=1 Tax=Chenopodium quinoa TaxID=63459 RepID=UPI000B77311F|nr:uncharacterized protein LOC110719148 [Chenopodium quinoa]